MRSIWDSLSKFYSSWLQPNFNSLISFLVNNQYAVYILIIFLIVLSFVRRIFQKKTQIQTLPKLIDFITAMIVILLIIVAYTTFAPAISKFFNFDTSTKDNSTNQTKSTTPTESTSGTENTPTQTVPSTQTTKQLYYGGGCYSCYADGCPRDGYSYGGYDASMYYYYKSLCQACRCNTSNWQSIWR